MIRCYCLIVGICVLGLSAHATDKDIQPLLRPVCRAVPNPESHIAEENAQEIERVNAILLRLQAAQAAKEPHTSDYNEYVAEGIHVPF